MTLYSLATETYSGSEINVDLFATRRDAYEALARLILPTPSQAARLNSLLKLIEKDPLVEYDTAKAFEVEMEATEWIGVVQHQYLPDTPTTR